jgi:hypothetical protein
VWPALLSAVRAEVVNVIRSGDNGHVRALLLQG